MTTPRPKNRQISRAVKIALMAGSGTLLTIGNPVLAQEDVTEEVLVTGSNIPRADIDSASPVTVLDRNDIVAQGLVDVGNIIQRMPAMSGSPIGTTTNNGGNGSVQVDLRGLGVNRTLTLVNGKRVVDGGDYQTIPSTMIERVEILKDGASAVYGADAVAGVVNIITRKDFEGVSVEAQTADFFDMKQGQQSSVGFIAGKAFDGGNFVFGAEYVNQEEAYQRDAPWAYFQDSYYIYPEGCENQVAAPYDGTPTGGCYPIGSSRIPEGRLNSAEWNYRTTTDDMGNTVSRNYDWFNDEFQWVSGALNPDYDPTYGIPTFNNGTTWMNPGSGLTAFDGRTYNYAPVNFIQTPYERTNLFVEGNFEITPTLRFTSSIRGNLRTSTQELAPQPYNSPTDPAYAGLYQRLDTDPASPNYGGPLMEVDVTGPGPDGMLGTADDETLTVYNDGSDPMATVVAPVAYSGISPDNFYNTLVDEFGNSVPVRDARRRMVETTRSFDQDITQYQANMGLEGELGDYNWHLDYSRGHRSRVDGDFGQFFGPALRNAMGPSADLDMDGTPECYEDINDPGTIIAGCVPFNFFGGPNSVTQDMLDYVGVDLVDTFVTRLEEFGGGMSGTAFELPGGTMGWAAGVGYRGENFTYSPDSAKQQDEVTGNTGAGTKGSLYSKNVYGEVLLPLMNNGTQAVDFSAGVRYDSYNIFGSDTTWQAGIEFQAIDDLKLRATAGTVFRAPTISDLFGGQVDSFPTYVDPCAQGGTLPPGCTAPGLQLDNQVLARVGGNPLLIPETGDTFTAGAVWTPEFLDGASLTVDYWQTDIEDGISSLGVQFILDDCYLRNNASSCALITRRADQSIAQIIDGGLNVAEQGASGIDTEVRYSFDTSFGQFETSLLWAHLNERTKKADPTSAEVDLSGRYTDPTAQDGGAYAEDKLNYAVQWFNQGLSVGLLGEFISELDADTFCNCGAGNQPDGSYIQKIDSQLYHDLVGSYDFGQGTTVSLGITNITDEEPPFIEVGFNASTDPSTYRLFGRGYYLRLTHSVE